MANGGLSFEESFTNNHRKLRILVLHKQNTKYNDSCVIRAQLTDLEETPLRLLDS
jgi:hypothetical protein